jgi:drug/metabolite transporter (DMT)-like permease
MVLSLYPLIVLLLLATQGEPIIWRDWVRLGLAMAGVYLLTAFDSQVDPLGVALVLGAAVGYAVHMALIQWYLSEYPPQTVALYTVTTMGILLVVIWVLRVRSWQPLSLLGWGVILGTGLVSTAAARLAMFAAIHCIGSGQVALLGPLETFLGVLWATLLLGERLTLTQWAGGLLILFSAMLVRGHRV